jgi:hypothetical protein
MGAWWQLFWLGSSLAQARARRWSSLPLSLQAATKQITAKAHGTMLLRNWRHNILSVNELYERATLPIRALSTKRQFLVQVTEPQGFVNAS